MYGMYTQHVTIDSCSGECPVDVDCAITHKSTYIIQGQGARHKGRGRGERPADRQGVVGRAAPELTGCWLLGSDETGKPYQEGNAKD